MKSASETYLLRKDEKIGKDIRDNIAKIDWRYDIIPPEYFKNELDVIKRRYSYTLKPIIIDEYENKEICPIYSDRAKVSHLLPIFFVKNKIVPNTISGVLNLEAVGANRDKQGDIKIDTKKLYGYLECAYISKELLKDERLFTFNQRIKKLSTQCYVKLVRKILDKKFSINLMPEKADRISYIVGKFFLIYVLELPESDGVNNVAYTCTSGNTPKNVLFSTDLDFPKENYKDLETFIKSLSEYFDVLKNLTTSLFVREYMTMYGDDAILSLESYQRLLEVIFTSCIFEIRSYRDKVVDSVLNKDSLDLYTEVTRVLSR